MRSWLRRRLPWARPRRATAISAREGYRRWAATYGVRANELQRLEAESLQGELPRLSGLRVLDLGCGPGRISTLAVERGAGLAVGVDSILAMLLRGSGRAAGPRVAADLSALPLAAESFDVIVAALCVGHVERLEPAIAEAARVLRPRGRLVVSDFHPEATRRGMQRTFVDEESRELFAVEQHLHPLEEFVAVLRRCGFGEPRLTEASYAGTPMVFVLQAPLDGLHRSGKTA